MTVYFDSNGGQQFKKPDVVILENQIDREIQRLKSQIFDPKKEGGAEPVLSGRKRLNQELKEMTNKNVRCCKLTPEGALIDFKISRSESSTEGIPNYLISIEGGSPYSIIVCDGGLFIRGQMYASIDAFLKDELGKDKLRKDNQLATLSHSQESEEMGDGERSLESKTFLDKNLPHYYDNDSGTIQVKGVTYELITGSTQGFSKKCLVSYGSSPTREGILLDPRNSPLLRNHYANFRSGLTNQLSNVQILLLLNDYVRTRVFSVSNSYVRRNLIDSIVKKARKAENLGKEYPPCIPMDAFLKVGAGLCRHYALVSCYFLDRLLSEKDPLIQGTVQHMRSRRKATTPSGEDRWSAHTWVVFIPEYKDNLEKWHFDPAKDVLSNFATDDGKEYLIDCYGDDLLDLQLLRTKSAAVARGQLAD